MKNEFDEVVNPNDLVEPIRIADFVYLQILKARDEGIDQNIIDKMTQDWINGKVTSKDLTKEQKKEVLDWNKRKFEELMNEQND